MSSRTIDIREENWLHNLLPRVTDLARAAGRAILEIYAEEHPEVEYKQDNSPLTRADVASHHIIMDGLATFSLGWPILSEESAEVPFAVRRSWRYFWMVDPLDGTKEFLSRTGEFTVNIALMERSAPILGVVYAPVVDKLYFAARGSGAFRIDRGSHSKIRTACASGRTVRMVASRSHRSREEDLQRFVRDEEVCELIIMGSSLKFCLIAEGGADIYPRVGSTMEWDTAAAQCILEEAGGSLTDLDGNSMTYNKPTLLNPGFLARASSQEILPRL